MDELKTESRRIAASILFFAITATAAIVLFITAAVTWLAGIIGSGVTAGLSRKITGGFTIGPKDGGYFISFTDETFIELISGYLRPATRKILFG